MDIKSYTTTIKVMRLRLPELQNSYIKTIEI